MESNSHEEPGKLEEVAKYASGWFRCYFQIKRWYLRCFGCWPKI